MAECTNCLSLDRIVQVKIDLENVLDQAEFGCITIITSEVVAGVVDSNNAYKKYTTLEEVATDWSATTAAYKSAKAIFSQVDRASIVNIAYLDLSSGNFTTLEDRLNELMKCIDCQGILTPTLGDGGIAIKTLFADWAEAKDGDVFYFTHTDNDDTLISNNATSIAAVFAQKSYKYTSVFYHSSQAAEFAAAALSYGLGQDLDVSGSSFTMAYKTLVGIEPDYLTNAQVTAATGVIPDQGCSRDYGHFANIYTCIAGVNMMLYGHMSDGNYFDTALLSQYLKARIQERVSQRIISQEVAQTADGYIELAHDVSFILSQAQDAGWIRGDNTQNGELGYQVLVPNIDNATKADLQCRITSPIQWKATLAGRVHHTSVSGLFQF